MGSLCKEPNLRITPSGHHVCDLLVAVNRKSGVADYLPVIVWDEDAAACGRSLKTGLLVHVLGRLSSRNYEKADGSRHVAIEVIASKTTFLSAERAGGHKNANMILLMGNLCREPNLRVTSAGKIICDLIVAVNRKTGGTDYLPVICWNKDAESCDQHLYTGALVHVKGILTSRNYERADGSRHVAIEVSAQEIEFLGGAARREGRDPRDTDLQDKVPGEMAFRA
jgi:single-strand DNA-binding protein